MTAQHPDLKKVVVIGPESTGKSTLSCALAALLRTAYVPEYARAYLETLMRPYTEADLLAIAEGQLALEDRMAAEADRVLICDTDLYVLKVWSEHRFGRCDPWILERIAERRYDLYLLADIDVSWQEDPLREHPAPEMRRYFYQIYKDIVQHSGVPWTEISGGETRRLEMAAAVVHGHFGG